jgi:hypothetical protein
VESSIESAGHASVVLARTNATVISEVVEALDGGRKPFIVGGAEELKRLVGDVYELKKGQPAKSPEFFGFQSWMEVVSFAKTEEGESLLRFVQLVEKHGEGGLWRAVTSTAANEDSADQIVSTAHKAKGCEWDCVRLASDFVSTSPKAGRGLSEAEVRLFYVAMTRAKSRLVVDDAVLKTFASGAWKNIGKIVNKPDSIAGASTGSVLGNKYSPRTHQSLSPEVRPLPAIAVSTRTNSAEVSSTSKSSARSSASVRGAARTSSSIKKISTKKVRTEPPSLLKRISKFLGL